MANMFTLYNLDDIIEDLMEVMDGLESSNHGDSDIEGEDMLEPESLHKEYNENAVDDTTTQKQYGKMSIIS